MGACSQSELWLSPVPRKAQGKAVGVLGGEERGTPVPHFPLEGQAWGPIAERVLLPGSPSSERLFSELCCGAGGREPLTTADWTRCERLTKLGCVHSWKSEIGLLGRGEASFNPGP